MKYPHIQQHDEKDCGAACLCMISEYYGLKITITKARYLIKVDNSGANIYGLVDGAEKLGLRGTGLSGDFNELKAEIDADEIKTPFIARILNNYGYEHFVVVWKFNENVVEIGDPGLHRKISYPTETFSKMWMGQIVTFEKTEKFHTGDEKKGSFRKFFKFISAQKKLVSYVCGISLLISGINVTGSFVFDFVVKESQKSVITEQTEKIGAYQEKSTDIEANELLQEDIPDDSAVRSENFSNQVDSVNGKLDGLVAKWMPSLKAICITAILLYLLKMIVEIIRGKAMAKTSKLIEFPLTMEYYDHLMDLPAGFYGNRKTGEYMSRFNDTAYIKSAIGNATMTIVLDSIMAVVCGIFLCWLSPVLFLITCITIAIYMIILFIFKRPLSDINHKIMESDSVLTSYLKESIDGIETIKSYNYMTPVKEKTHDLYEKQLDHGVKGNILDSTLNALMTAVSSISIVVLLWFGASLCLKGVLVLSDLIVFYYMLGYFIKPVGNLVNLQPSIQMAMVAAERLNDILDAEVENNEKSAPENLKGDIVFNNVDFCYGNRELVLNDLSIVCKSGTKTALVGESGSGKTTISKLLMAFHDTISGDITIGGVPINKYAPTELRKHIAYISQTTFLFSDTIMNNIKVGNPDATDEEVEDICKKCGISTFVDRLPMRYSTQIEENGANLSGGQRQRIAIARALIRKPDILIMDEATSNLDTISENMIRDVIDSLSTDITVIIIAHRLKTVRNCDNIYVMKDGSVVEEGTHDQLLAHNGFYAKIWN